MYRDIQFVWRDNETVYTLQEVRQTYVPLRLEQLCRGNNFPERNGSSCPKNSSSCESWRFVTDGTELCVEFDRRDSSTRMVELYHSLQATVKNIWLNSFHTERKEKKNFTLTIAVCAVIKFVIPSTFQNPLQIHVGVVHVTCQILCVEISSMFLEWTKGAKQWPVSNVITCTEKRIRFVWCSKRSRGRHGKTRSRMIRYHAETRKLSVKF